MHPSPHLGYRLNPHRPLSPLSRLGVILAVATLAAPIAVSDAASSGRSQLQLPGIVATVPGDGAEPRGFEVAQAGQAAGVVSRTETDLQSQSMATTAELERLNEQLARYREILATARAELEAAAAEGTHLSEALAQHRETLAQSQETLNTIRTDLETAVAERDRLGQELAQSQETLTSTRTELETAVAERDRLAQELAQSQETLTSTRTELETAVAERDRLGQELAQSQETLASTRAELDSTVAERDRLGQELGQTQEILQSSRSALDETQTVLADIRQTLAAAQGSITELTTAKQQLSVENQGLQADIEVLRAQLAHTQARLNALQDGTATLKARLPEPLGGTASAAQLQEQARATWEPFQDTYDQLRRDRENIALADRFDRLGNELSARQFLVAQATGARGVYRVRAQDTLALLAERIYGDHNRWSEIFEANGHILEDPAWIIPEMSLVVP